MSTVSSLELEPGCLVPKQATWEPMQTASGMQMRSCSHWLWLYWYSDRSSPWTSWPEWGRCNERILWNPIRCTRKPELRIEKCPLGGDIPLSGSIHRDRPHSSYAQGRMVGRWNLIAGKEAHPLCWFIEISWRPSAISCWRSLRNAPIRSGE